MAAASRPMGVITATTRDLVKAATMGILPARGGVASSSRGAGVTDALGRRHGSAMRSTGASFDITRGLATASPITQHGGGKDDPHAEQITVTFIEKDGTNTVVKATVGQSMLEVAHKNDIELEGACEGSLACSTCHLILEKDVYDALPAPEEEEEDMLDLAMDLTDTSRLGCQITVTKELAGMVARVPSGLV